MRFSDKGLSGREAWLGACIGEGFPPPHLVPLPEEGDVLK